jgi:hypothetical protein
MSRRVGASSKNPPSLLSEEELTIHLLASDTKIGSSSTTISNPIPLLLLALLL